MVGHLSVAVLNILSKTAATDPVPVGAVRKRQSKLGWGEFLGFVDIRFDPDARACAVWKTFEGENGLVVAGSDTT